jgi:hypothetical protein
MSKILSSDEVESLCSTNIEHIETFFLFIISIIITIGFYTNGYPFIDSIILGYSIGVISKMILLFIFHVKHIMEYILLIIVIIIFILVSVLTIIKNQ